MKALGIYIHVPFCVRKCSYCDFLSAPAGREQQRQYMQALKKEITLAAASYQDYTVATIFWGGGTPSILEAEQITDCMEAIYRCYHVEKDAEITLEMNPKTASWDKMCQLRKAGINRLSIGLQSTENEQLSMLGRVHTYEDFLSTYELARKAGFTNVNVDLMSAIPGQTPAEWEQTLQKTVALKPEHISAYSLIIEEGTPLCQNLAQYPALPTEEEDRQMYQNTQVLLAAYGYERYEISNYARKGYESRHNITYWVRGEYAGFGLGASSMVNNNRWQNTQCMEDYLHLIKEGRISDLRTQLQHLSQNECMEETMYLGLRMMRGVSRKRFQECFRTEMEEIYGKVLEKWEKRGYLERCEDRIRLTEKGIDVSNVILADFLLDE